MLLKKCIKSTLFVVCLSVVFIAQSQNAYAWKAVRPYGHVPHHRRIRKLPARHRTVLVRGLPYYYYSGAFYRKARTQYVIVTAPVGAVVQTLPTACPRIVIDGTTYYTYDNVYYRQAPQGYTVVRTPVVTTPVSVSPVSAEEDTYVVNVPNANGSYTPVVIKKVDSAYVGPQGEYYAQPPTVEQLQVMYAK